jgi:hypothetical protein
MILIDHNSFNSEIFFIVMLETQHSYQFIFLYEHLEPLHAKT